MLPKAQVVVNKTNGHAYRPLPLTVEDTNIEIIEIDPNAFELNDESTEETDALIPKEEASPQNNGWFSWLTGAKKPTVTDTPKESWVKTTSKTVLKFMPAVGLSLTTAYNSLLMISGKNIQSVDDWAPWWHSMNLGKKIFSLVSAFSSIRVNIPLNMEFFSTVWLKLKTSFQNCTKNTGQLINTIIAGLFGLGGGIAQAIIAFESFEWSGRKSAFIASGSTFSIYSLGRFTGINKLIDRLFLNRRIIATQATVIDKLKHAEEACLKELETFLQAEAQKLVQLHRNKKNEPEKLNDDDYEKLFAALGEKLTELAALHPDYIREKTNDEYAKEYAFTTLQLALAAFIGTFSFMTFTQKTTKGINLLVTLMTGHPLNIDNTSLSGRAKNISIGLVGGIPSAALYSVAAYDFLPLLVDTARYLRHHPDQIKSFIADLFFNFFGATAMFKVGKDMPGPNNLFDISATDVTCNFFAFADGSGAGELNFNASLKKYQEKPHALSPSPKEVIDYFHNPAIRQISSKTAEGLNQHSLFNKSAQKTSDTKSAVSSSQAPVATRKFGTPV